MPTLHPMKIPFVSGLGFFVAASAVLHGAPDPDWLGHDRARPQPVVVTPGTASSQEQAGTPPSDATVLFDGKDHSQWVAMDGSPTKWIVKNGALECVPGSGYVGPVTARDLMGCGQSRGVATRLSGLRLTATAVPTSQSD